jgi:hypothetical protein
MPKNQNIKLTDNNEMHFQTNIDFNSTIVLYMHGSFMDKYNIIILNIYTFEIEQKNEFKFIK